MVPRSEGEELSDARGGVQGTHSREVAVAGGAMKGGRPTPGGTMHPRHDHSPSQ
jgi:hypothetical protein